MAVPRVDKKLLAQLDAMGFLLAPATRALHYSSNSSLEDAINWLMDHENDKDIDQIPIVAVDIEIMSPNLFPIPEQIKERAYKLRIQACQKGKRKMEKEVEMEEAKRMKLEVPMENTLIIQPSTPAVQEKKNSLPLKSSTVLECMGECLRTLKRDSKDDNARVTMAFQTLLIYVGNVVKEPNEEIYRKIRINNPSFQRKVASIKGGMEFLVLCGFEKADGGEFLVLPSDKVNMEILKLAQSELKSALENPYFGLLSKGLPEINVYNTILMKNLTL